MMWEARRRGFKRIRISTISDPVFRVRANPPTPFRAEVLYQIKIRECIVEMGGEKVLPYENIQGSKGAVIVHLHG